MSYTDLRDFSAEVVAYFENDDFDIIEIQVQKLGGGTVGSYYEGSWRYIVTNTNTGREVARGQDFQSAVTITHQRAAEIIFKIIDDRDE